MTLRDVGSLRRAYHEVHAAGSHTRAEWLQKLEDQGFMCCWCGKKLRDKKGNSRATKDHLQPISRGGRNDIANIAAACRPCNSRKRDRTAEEYSALLLSEGKRIPTVCTVTAFKEELIFSRSLPPEVTQFTDQIPEKKFPSRPDHYWKERRAFLRWQVRQLAKDEGASLVLKGIDLQERKA
jgi:hypothetical protein